MEKLMSNPFPFVGFFFVICKFNHLSIMAIAHSLSLLSFSFFNFRFFFLFLVLCSPWSFMLVYWISVFQLLWFFFNLSVIILLLSFFCLSSPPHFLSCSPVTLINFWPVDSAWVLLLKCAAAATAAAFPHFFVCFFV